MNHRKNNLPHIDVIDIVMGRINDGDVKIRSKRSILFERVITVFVSVLLTTVCVVGLMAMIIGIRQSAQLELADFGNSIGLFIASLPWVSILLVGSTAAVLWLLRHSLHNLLPKFRLQQVAASVLIFVGTVSIFGPIARAQELPALLSIAAYGNKAQPETFRGKIISLSEYSFTLQQDSGPVLILFVQSGVPDEFKIGQKVLLFGNIRGNRLTVRDYKILVPAPQQGNELKKEKVVEQTETLVKPPKQQASSDTPLKPAPSLNKSIAISATRIGTKKYEINWQAKNFSSKYGFKIVWSTEKNPKYPGATYVAYSDATLSGSQYIGEKPDENYYYVRVCEYLAEGTCGLYSAEVKIVFD